MNGDPNNNALRPAPVNENDLKPAAVNRPRFNRPSAVDTNLHPASPHDVRPFALANPNDVPPFASANPDAAASADQNDP